MENGNAREYGLKAALINSVALPRAVTGQYIARAQLTLIERAYEAADMYDGLSRLIQPTKLQCATLWHVNPTYVAWAIKRPADRALVESAAVPLVPPPAPKVLPTPVSPQERLASVVAEVGVTGALNMLAAIDKGGQLAA